METGTAGIDQATVTAGVGGATKPTVRGGASALSHVRTPSCPNCGEYAGQYTRYEEEDGMYPIVTRLVTRLHWSCVKCSQDVTVEAKEAAPDIAALGE